VDSGGVDIKGSVTISAHDDLNFGPYWAEVAGRSGVYLLNQLLRLSHTLSSMGPEHLAIANPCAPNIYLTKTVLSYLCTVDLLLPMRLFGGFLVEVSMACTWANEAYNCFGTQLERKTKNRRIGLLGDTNS
jgi:hypothetical protein